MVSTSKSAVLFVSIMSTIQPTNGFLLSFLFERLLSPVVQEACELVETELGLQSVFDCACNLDYLGLFSGFEGSVVCNSTANVCLQPPDGYCATAGLDVGAQAGLFIDAGLNTALNACFDIVSGTPGGIDVPNFCFTFKTTGLELVGSCDVKIGDVGCLACNVCDSGTEFTFDCSNVKFGEGIFQVDGPKVDTCVGLNGVSAV